MHVACVLVDHLPFKLEVQRDPSLARQRVIIFQRHGSLCSVLDTSPAIQQIQQHMPLQEALALCKDASPMEADLPRYQQAFDALSLRLRDWSPIVEAADLGCAYVGLDGLEGPCGAAELLADALLGAIPRHLEPRLGVSRGKFPAYLAALRAEPGRVYRPRADTRQFLAPFPVEVLPVPWSVKERLRGFGLDTLGKIADLPLGPLQAQFGPTGVKLWRLTHGQDDTPLVSQQPEDEATASTTFFVPTANLQPLLVAVDHLLAKLFAQPGMRNRCARIALLQGHILDSPAWQRRVTFKAPVGNQSRAYSILKAALADVALPGPLEEVSLTLRSLTGEVGRQESLFGEVRRREQLRETIAQIKAAQGRNPIYQVREVEPLSRILERRRALVAYEP